MGPHSGGATWGLQRVVTMIKCFAAMVTERARDPGISARVQELS